MDKVISIGRLEDGRYAVENERDISDLTHEDLVAMLLAFRIWWDLKRTRLGTTS